MRNSAAFRLVSHICLFFSAAVLVPLFRPADCTAYFIIAASAFIACCAAVYLDSAALRLPVSLVPLAVLFFILRPKSVTIPIIVNALPLIYAAAILTVGRFRGDVWVCRMEVRLLSLFIFPLIALTIYYQALSVKNVEQRAALSYAWALYFFFLLFAFLSLRTMRSGELRSAKWQGGTIGAYLLAVAFAAAVGLLLRFSLPAFKFIVMLIVLPLALIIWLVSMAAGALASKYAAQLSDFYATAAPITPSPQEQTAPAPVSIATAPSSNFLDDFGKGFGFSKEAVIIGVIVLLAIAVIVITLMHTGKLTKNAVSLSPDLEGADPAASKRTLFKIRRKAPAANAEKVRDVYRRYLGYLRRNGVQRHPGSTSGDISELANAVLGDKTDELLRALYLRARYAADEISEEEVRLATLALERIVSDGNRK